MERLTQLNFAKCAEDVIQNKIMKRKGGKNFQETSETPMITTSKIRNMLELTNTLYNKLIKYREEELSDEIMSYIQYVRMKFAYEYGRDYNEKRKTPVSDFIKQAQIMNHLESIGNSREQALIFCKYMESLVAFHKFYGGRDK